jgi:NAD(P)-dependent dehydrogenase (short-subunit alcohol dehydrogenase family)
MKRTVVITGCSTGFGRELAQDLARKGDRVYATMRGVKGANASAAKELQALATKEKLDLRLLELDVTSTSSVVAAAVKVLAESDAPDVLVDNAGQFFLGVTEAFTPEELASQLDVNLVGAHRVNRAFLPAMRKRGRGLVIAMSSVAGRVSMPFFGVYQASKWALEGYTMALQSELASSGIDVVLVEPGPFNTEIFGKTRLAADADGRAKTYPEIVHQSFDQIGASVEQITKDPSAPTSPKLVADRMVELIEMKPGTRPFRSVVGLDFGVRERNAALEPMDAALLETMGLKAMATLNVRP